MQDFPMDTNVEKARARRANRRDMVVGCVGWLAWALAAQAIKSVELNRGQRRARCAAAVMDKK
jgi:hypothetical protein